MGTKRFGIVGFGTAGITAALFLARAGHKVTVFERFPEPRAVGAGILLQPTGMEVLRRLDLLSELEKTAARIDALDGRTPAGKCVVDVSYSHLAVDCYALGVHRANLLNVLHAAAEDVGVEMLWDVEVTAVRQKTGGAASLVLSNGDEMDGFDGVVIANGTQSRLREQLRIPQSASLILGGHFGRSVLRLLTSTVTRFSNAMPGLPS